jgi:hypothetical protein
MEDFPSAFIKGQPFKLAMITKKLGTICVALMISHKSSAALIAALGLLLIDQQFEAQTT